MSATNRGAEYRELAAYMTAIDDCRGLVRLLAPILATPQVVLEPSVGGGNWIRALLEESARTGVRHRYVACDINAAADGLRMVHEAGGLAYAGDFLAWTPPVAPTLILGNPPYSIPQPGVTCPLCGGARVTVLRGGPKPCAKCGNDRRPPTGIWTPPPIPAAARHVDHALSLLAPSGTAAFVVRLGLSESEDRIAFWARHGDGRGLLRTYGLARRLSFTGGGTDQTAYGLYVWRRGYVGPARFTPGFDHLAP